VTRTFLGVLFVLLREEREGERGRRGEEGDEVQGEWMAQEAGKK
jgi:hypothetical protein